MSSCFDVHHQKQQMDALARLLSAGMVHQETLLALHDTGIHPEPLFDWSVPNPDGDGWIAQQIERRVSYKRAMKQALQRAMRFGAQGAMVTCAGRLFGAEMARRETTREGRVPRHTLRANIDFAQADCQTQVQCQAGNTFRFVS